MVGLSPFNKFYSTRNIETVIGWAARRFSRVEVLLPGYEVAFGSIAAGRTAHDAVRRTRRTIRGMRAVARRALERTTPQADQRIYTWTQLADQQRYCELRTTVERVYHTSNELRQLCIGTARDYLIGALGHEPTPEQIELNLGYVRAELPFVIDVPGIMHTDAAMLLYNRNWPLQDALWAGAVPELAPTEGHGFGIVELADPC